MLKAQQEALLEDIATSIGCFFAQLKIKNMRILHNNVYFCRLRQLLTWNNKNRKTIDYYLRQFIDDK
jgi:hypothetical protein